MTCFPVDKIEQYCPSEKAGTVRLLVPSYLQYNNFDIISSDSSALPIPPILKSIMHFVTGFIMLDICIIS